MHTDQQHRFQMLMDALEDILGAEPKTEAERIRFVDSIIKLRFARSWSEVPKEMKLRAVQKCREIVKPMSAKIQDGNNYEDMLEDLLK